LPRRVTAHLACGIAEKDCRALSSIYIDERVSAVVAAKVTTAVPQERYLYCALADWQDEGLLRPLRAQVVPLFEVSRADVLRDTPLGTLTERDRVALQAALDAADGHGL
jgi:hypothetical protein